ncbi:MAG: ATP-binding protein [Firmicutes bacterium]|nr:ATP-binding protein [Bacillota bacterium]
MERKIEKQIELWKNSKNRMPLIINGARQVGKTYTALSVGKKYYKNTVYFNMEDSREITEIFERDLNPQRIIKELSVRCAESIFPEDTLIIFDEIQASERALLSLKYFCENAPEYHIIAAGSLLGVALNREKYSYPVGKADMLTMYPMDFEEFLWALGKRDLAELIRKSAETMEPFSLHDTAMDLYKIYLFVGGMPRVVKDYLETGDFNFVTAALKNINDAYIADMAKYASPAETTKIMNAFNSIPAQLAKPNKKFQYKVIKSGARAYEYETPIEWLKASGVINQCIKVKEGKLPLMAYAENEAFKIYLTDTGLLCSKFALPANSVIYDSPSFDGFKGALAENYVGFCLKRAGYQPYYWESDGKAEIDFVIQSKNGDIVPIEVKSSEHVRAKSLGVFMDRYDIKYAIRISAKNFGYENKIKSIPLYAVFTIE